MLMGDVHEREREHRQRAEERHGQADHDPGGDLHVQEDAENDQHQQCAERHVLEHQVEPAFQVVGPVGPGSELYAIRQRQATLGDVAVDRFADLDLVAGPVSQDADAETALTIEERIALDLDKPVADGRDVAEPNPGSIRLREQDDLLELRAGICLTLGPQPDLTGFGPDRATGQVDGPLAYDLGDLAQGQSVLAQRLLGDFDGDFEWTRTGHLGQRHLRQGCDLVAQFFRQLLHGNLVQISVDLDAQNTERESALGDHRPFGFFGKGRNAVDGHLDVVGNRIDVVAMLDFRLHAAHTFHGGGFDLFDSLDRLDRLLDLQHHAFGDFLGRPAPILHGYRDLVGSEVRKALLLDGGERPDSHPDDGEHQQVCGHVVAGEPSDQAALPGRDGQRLRLSHRGGPAFQAMDCRWAWSHRPRRPRRRGRGKPGFRRCVRH